ncbi:MAG: RnfABCDGE type electron transport complex subunit D [Phycisphaerae bacterium]|nr:RnfABCDGE type electron transport complex subunit D [Phycisphaerae bacterium]
MAEEAKNNEPSAPVLHVAPGPHLQDVNLTTRRMMLDVLIGLAPVIVAATIFFRQYAWLQFGVCVGTCCLSEAICSAIRRKPIPLPDLSAVVTGLILALSLPWNSPIYVSVIGSAVAIVLGKVIFGGLGQNIFNPAMVGRAFVMLSFAAAIGAPAYVLHTGENPANPIMDVVSGATPMTALKESGGVTPLLALLLGNTYGSLGETSALACLLGGMYLCIRRTASWEIPAGVILAAVVISSAIEGYLAATQGGGLLNFIGNGGHWGVLSEVLGGALLFGAFFIATDPVTSPLTPKGKFIFGLGVGIFIMFIRKLSVYPEGVMFAVLLMNSVTPLINRWTVPKPLGTK